MGIFLCGDPESVCSLLGWSSVALIHSFHSLHAFASCPAQTILRTSDHKRAQQTGQAESVISHDWFSSSPLFFIPPEDIDECQPGRCHQDAVCYNTQGSFTCQCRSGYYGDGFYCSPGKSCGMPSLSDKQTQHLTLNSASLLYIQSSNIRPVLLQVYFGCLRRELRQFGNSRLWCSCRLCNRKMYSQHCSLHCLFLLEMSFSPQYTGASWNLFFIFFWIEKEFVIPYKGCGSFCVAEFKADEERK